MARGGKRPGSGRKRGVLTKRTQELAAAATADGVTPLEYLMQTMRDATADPSMRFEAAKAAAPYCHPRLASVEHSGNQQNPVSFIIATGVPREAAN